MGWAVRAAQIAGGVDQRDVRKGLRKIAELTFQVGIVLFGNQANIVT